MVPSPGNPSNFADDGSPKERHETAGYSWKRAQALQGMATLAIPCSTGVRLDAEGSAYGSGGCDPVRSTALVNDVDHDRHHHVRRVGGYVDAVQDLVGDVVVRLGLLGVLVALGGRVGRRGRRQGGEAEDEREGRGAPDKRRSGGHRSDSLRWGM